jgi:uncharacterized protein YajQ (UPF0234 family)
MPSFDVVNKIDHQTLDNVVNVVRKEIVNRFDFKDSKTILDLDKKQAIITVTTENTMRLESVQDVLRSRMVKQRLDPLALDFGKEHYASGNMIRKEIKLKEGIDKDAGRNIIKAIKSTKLKVEAQMMDDQIRVSGKKIDDLQAVMGQLRQGDFGLPIQFINFK